VPYFLDVLSAFWKKVVRIYKIEGLKAAKNKA